MSAAARGMLHALVVAGLVLAGCERLQSKATVDFRRAQPAGTSGGPWVARFGGDTVTAAEVSARLAEMSPAARSRFQSLEPRRDYVEGIVRFELLAREAVRAGLANDADVVEAARRVMVQTLLKRTFEQMPAVGDAEVRRYYEAHLGDYVKPRMTRLSHIRFAKEDRAKAEAVLSEVKALRPLDVASFGRLAREHSQDEHTRELDGDMRLVSDDELTRRYGPELRLAAAALTQAGEVAPALVETATALHIVKLQGRQPPLELTLEQARTAITQQLVNDGRQERLNALLARLKTEARFELDEKSLGAIVVDPKAPQVEPKGPPPGYQPAPAVRP